MNRPQIKNRLDELMEESMTDFSSMDSDWKGVRKNLWWSKMSVWLNPSLVAALFVGVVASHLVNFEKSPSFSKANSSDEMATIKNIPNLPEKSTDTYVPSESPQNNVQDESINAQIAIEESKNIESTKRNQTFSLGNENNKSQNVINKKNTVKKTELNTAENALAQGFEENKLNISSIGGNPNETEAVSKNEMNENIEHINTNKGSILNQLPLLESYVEGSSRLVADTSILKITTITSTSELLSSRKNFVYTYGEVGGIPANGVDFDFSLGYGRVINHKWSVQAGLIYGSHKFTRDPEKTRPPRDFPDRKPRDTSDHFRNMAVVGKEFGGEVGVTYTINPISKFPFRLQFMQGFMKVLDNEMQYSFMGRGGREDYQQREKIIINPWNFETKLSVGTSIALTNRLSLGADLGIQHNRNNVFSNSGFTSPLARVSLNYYFNI